MGSSLYHTCLLHNTSSLYYHLLSPTITYYHLLSPTITYHHLPSPTITYYHLLSPTDMTELFFDTAASTPSFDDSATPDVDPFADFLEELTETDLVLLPCDVLEVLL